MHCNKIKTKKIVKNKKLQKIKKFRFQIILYREINLDKNLIEKTNLQKLINIVLIIKIFIKVSNIKYLIIEFSCIVKIQLTNTII